MASSSSDDTASLWRSSDFGVITISGLRTARSICRRSMWNICAGVVGTHTCMLSQRAQLQEALEARGGMLRALAFVAVRQEQRQAAQAVPLRFAGADELVDDDLRAVGEIAELALPR